MTAAEPSPIRTAIAGMAAMAAAMGIGRFVYTPLLPGMMEDLAISAANAGLIASANYAGYLIGAVLAVGAWGQGRERRIALVSLGASTVLAAAMALTSSIGLFLAIRFLAGVASAFVMIFISTIILSRLALAGRPDLQAWHFGGVGLGIAASAIMTLVLGNSGWQGGWIGAALLSLAGAIAVYLLIGPAQIRTAASAAPEPAPRFSASLRRITLAYGLFGFGYIVTATFLVAIVREGDQARSFEGVVWLVTGLAGLPSVWLWNRLARRIGMTRTFAMGCAVEALGVVASVAVPGPAGPLIGGALLGGTFIAVTAIGLQIGRDLAGEAPRRVLAIMTAAFGTGQIIGPLVAGVVADLAGNFVLASLLAAATLAVSAGLALSSGSGKRG
jgi:predicted MFS family arabinose efflux permease